MIIVHKSDRKNDSGISSKAQERIRMKHLFTVFLIMICNFFISASAPDSGSERLLRKAKEFTVRGEIPNSRKKAENGSAKTVYFGGSITEQNG